ncbi:MAG: hypothetical protein ACREJD_15915 [Phycisphaerales bacterium]
MIANGCGELPSASAKLTVCNSDFTCDGQVDDSDFVVFVHGYNLLLCDDVMMPNGCPADLNGDGLVDDADFVLFVHAYNELGCL